MPAIRGITVAVGDWYAATLDICLVKNMRHMTSCLVVTAPGDEAVKAVVAKVPGAAVFETDAFYRPDARGVVPHFNKGLAVQESFDVIGRDGWLLIHDADVIFPESLTTDGLTPDTLYGARRRVLEDVSRWSPSLDWTTCQPSRDGGPVGFFQLFNCQDVSIVNKSVWYDVSFGHCGGSDARFIAHWPKHKLRVLPCEVLHLGPTDTHWMGTDRKSIDLMAKFVTENGWSRAIQKHDPAAVARAGEIVHRVEVPGYDRSDFELPFVRRANEKKTRNNGV